MNKRLFMYVLAAGMMLGLVGQSSAADIAAATGVMADLEALVAQAKAKLAEAALGGDVDAIAEANKRSDAIDKAVASAQQYLATAEQSVADGNNDAADSAIDGMAAALKQAREAMEGILPETTAASQEEWKKSQENAGGGPGGEGEAPNIYDVPWKSQGIRAYYESLFGTFHDASGFGHGRGWGDHDATPE